MSRQAITPARPPQAAATAAAHMLQRQCACGNHTIGGFACDRCRHGRRAPEQPSDGAIAHGFGHDFSQARVHDTARHTFVPERPAAARLASSAGRWESPAERQANRMSAWIGQRLESISIGPGPMSDGVRRAVEPTLGVDLGGVRFTPERPRQAGGLVGEHDKPLFLMCHNR